MDSVDQQVQCLRTVHNVLGLRTMSRDDIVEWRCKSDRRKVRERSEKGVEVAGESEVGEGSVICLVVAPST